MAVMLEDREMPLTEHLEELRRRIILCLIALAAGTVIIFNWSGEFLSWLAKPVGGFIFVAPTEAFFTRFKVAMFGGFLLALPIILHQAWAFTACALGRGLRNSIQRVLPASYLLFLTGVALCVLVVVPNAVHFLMAYGSSEMKPMMAVGPYVDFVTGLSVAFGAVFQMPLILLLLNRLGIVTPEGLADKRRYVIFFSFVAAAILTPGPDVISQIALGVPMVLLFEVSLVLMRLSGRSAQ